MSYMCKINLKKKKKKNYATPLGHSLPVCALNDCTCDYYPKYRVLLCVFKKKKKKKKKKNTNIFGQVVLGKLTNIPLYTLEPQLLVQHSTGIVQLLVI